MRLLSLALLLAAAPLAAQPTPEPLPETFLRFTLSGTTDTGQPTTDWAFLRFLPDALPGWDPHDASKFSSAPAQIALVGRRDRERVRLGMNSGPDGSLAPLPRSFNVKMDLLAPEGGDLTLSWEGTLTPGWKITLVDRDTGTRVKMWRETSYSFTAKREGWGTRFLLRVRPDRSVTNATVSAPVAEAALTTARDEIGQPYPNPSTGPARLGLTLAEAGEVRVAVLDALGREVAVAHEGTLTAGTHDLALPTSDLPHGTYLVRITGDDLAETRRLTLSR
ncbi:MAG: T9SS type A sorting domain-containing protein [Bacteroidota bacterium]